VLVDVRPVARHTRPADKTIYKMPAQALAKLPGQTPIAFPLGARGRFSGVSHEFHDLID
jgi:hypothetical protein